MTKPVIALAAGAAVFLFAVVLGSRFLPADSGVGGPTSSPVPSPSPPSISGEFMFRANPIGNINVDVAASANGSTLSGTAAVSFRGGAATIRLQCSRRFDEQTWMLSGEIEESTGEGLPIGTCMAEIVRDGSPQQASIWSAEGPTADDCEAFVSAIPDSAVEGQDMITPMSSGSITLPRPATPATRSPETPRSSPATTR